MPTIANKPAGRQTVRRGARKPGREEALAVAIAESQKGYSVVALIPGCSEPREKWRHGPNGPIGIRTEAELREQWPRGPSAVGIITGLCGLIVPDFDWHEDWPDDHPQPWDRLMEVVEAAGHEMPETREIDTKRGFHQQYLENGTKVGTCSNKVRGIDGTPILGLDIKSGINLERVWDPREPERKVSNDADPIFMPDWLAVILNTRTSGSGFDEHAILKASSIDEAKKYLREVDKGGRHNAVGEFVTFLSGKGDDEMVLDTAVQFRKELHDKDGWEYHSGSADAEVREWLYGKKKDRPVFSSVTESRELESITVQRPGVLRPMEDEFWESLSVLSHIYAWAKARRVSPWAVFGECLAEAVCHTSPALVLPPIIGGRGSLNLLIALSGVPGLGKGGSAPVAQEAFIWHGTDNDTILGIPDEVPRIPIGSGEGLLRNYGYSFKDRESGQYVLVRTAYSVITEIKEIDTLKSVGDRGGATISPVIRQFYSGEQLGFGYADSGKRIIIPAHSYRGCVVAGVQPGRGEIILGDVDSGFAQRWLWLPARDPEMQHEKPVDPPPVREWNPPGIAVSLGGEDEHVVMGVYKEAMTEIVAAHVDKHQSSNADAMEAHSMYTRLKVAAGIAILDESNVADEVYWRLAAFVMKKSDAERAKAAGLLAAGKVESHREAGHLDGVRRASATDSEKKARVVVNITDKLKDAGDWMSRATLRSKIANRDRDVFPAALEGLVKLGTVETKTMVIKGQDSIRYRLRKGRGG